MHCETASIFPLKPKLNSRGTNPYLLTLTSSPGT